MRAGAISGIPALTALAVTPQWVRCSSRMDTIGKAARFRLLTSIFRARLQAIAYRTTQRCVFSLSFCSGLRTGHRTPSGDERDGLGCRPSPMPLSQLTASPGSLLSSRDDFGKHRKHYPGLTYARKQETRHLLLVRLRASRADKTAVRKVLQHS